jgi:hypothetical protein
METTLKNKIEEFLKSLNIDNLEITDFIDIEEIDLNNPFESIYDMLDEKDAFNIEIIYYHNAIEYLKENDPSLNESLEIAQYYGYELKNLNSELLASLLKTRNNEEEFYKLIVNIINKLEEKNLSFLKEV